VTDLMFHDFPHTLQRWTEFIGQPHDLQRVADRRKRISQLVSQRRQELFLSLVGLTHSGLGPAKAGHVVANFGDAARGAIRVAVENPVRGDVQHSAVFMAAEDLPLPFPCS
jgi:hypothetical protein